MSRAKRFSVRDEYAPSFGRQVLTLWSGGFASDYEGSAVELPGHDGFMVSVGGRKVRVSCESPRTDENFERVDAALSAACDVSRPHVGLSGLVSS